MKITQGVGSMTCAWLFCILALIGLPAALAKGGEGPVAWIAQTFLQLVLLSIIIVGTNIQSAASDKRAQDTYADAEAVLHEALQIQAHLEEQDKLLTALVKKVGAERLRASPAEDGRALPRQGRAAVIMGGAAPHGGLARFTWGRMASTGSWVV